MWTEPGYWNINPSHHSCILVPAAARSSMDPCLYTGLYPYVPETFIHRPLKSFPCDYWTPSTSTAWPLIPRANRRKKGLTKWGKHLALSQNLLLVLQYLIERQQISYECWVLRILCPRLAQTAQAGDWSHCSQPFFPRHNKILYTVRSEVPLTSKVWQFHLQLFSHTKIHIYIVCIYTHLSSMCIYTHKINPFPISA